MSRYPEMIMMKLRVCRGLETNDTTDDVEINLMSPKEALNDILCYEGIINYTEDIIFWVERIFNVRLNK